jgi:hypothetical protein
MWTFIEHIRQLESDTLHRNHAFHLLGLTSKLLEGNHTDHPIWLKLELESGHISKRRMEENYIIDQLDSGNDTINSMVSNPHWKSVLNSYGALKIGRRIYRFFDNGGVVIFANKDISAYDAAKNLQFAEISEGFNVRKTSGDAQEWANYHNVSISGETLSEKYIKELRVAQVQTYPNGTIKMENVSFWESVQVDYEWEYANGTISTGISPIRDFVINESYQLKAVDTQNEIKIINGSAAACQINNFSIIHLGGNKFSFSCSPFIPGFTPKWVFGDRTSQTGSAFAEHQYLNFPPNTTINVTIQALANGGSVVCSFTRAIIFGAIDCGIEKTKKMSKTFNDVDGTGQKWRIDASVWAINGSVGCSTKTLKRSGFIIHVWNARAVHMLSTKLKGYYWQDASIGTNKVCIRKDIDLKYAKLCTPNCTIDSYIEYIVAESKPRREANKLTSAHTFKRTESSTELFLDPLILD